MALVLLALLLSLISLSNTSYALSSFGFDIHHRFSEPVKGIFGIDKLPDEGTREYYVAMAHRDRVFHARRLADGGDIDQKLLTFSPDNSTYQIPLFGYLHFANVSVGTPSSWFLVALDTGSDLFWLPCNCTECVRGGIQTSSRQKIEFNIYDNKRSSTSKNVACNSSLCEQPALCSSSSGGTCPYQVQYLSENTSTSGFLVEDVLHLITDHGDQTKQANPTVTFGCGQVQTGAFLTGAAPNGLFGLGMSDVSVPSVLAKKGLTSNSFSMCFGEHGYGRITFGDNNSNDNNSLDQGKTPFNIRPLHSTYNITVTQIIVGGNVADLELNAIFDTGTSFTYLNNPAYKQITQSFDSNIKLQRHSASESDDLPFEYCYELSPNQTTVQVPTVNLTMKGGDNYYVMDPIVTDGNNNVLCLAVLKSNNLNIIGQNFMTGYRIVFDRENMALGWRESNCYDDELSSLPANRSYAPGISPAMAVNPEKTSNQSNNPERLPSSHSLKIKPAFAFTVAISLLLAIF
ncbi:aspartyl protease family protein 1 isoform X2 [Lathyrus oleraceus]|uniref:Peptidase A1 domain-containing protein n=2 Tax=Pisum sativum TaxID=3888 RepID=A0A9D5B7P8_PEA|nr:aspartyl protease family protein 1 isoform X2 [Pisum sativum]KAI5438697.1 hypothetical protein KIW84_024430 [Pisum sativum]